MERHGFRAGPCDLQGRPGISVPLTRVDNRATQGLAERIRQVHAANQRRPAVLIA